MNMQSANSRTRSYIEAEPNNAIQKYGVESFLCWYLAPYC